LGSLTKLADKAFVIGFLLPTLIATIAFLYLFNDVEPFHSAYNAALSIKGFTELTIAAVVMWTLASLLLIWNEWLYQFLEGYVGPFKNKSWQLKAKTVMRIKLKELKDEAHILKDPKASDENKLSHLATRREFFKCYPRKPELVLPTRFGNVIRAFEMYPSDAYGVEAISTWLRLQGVIPKDYAALVNDARSAVDFFVNVWFLAGAISVLATVRAMFAIHVNSSALGVGDDFWKFVWIAIAGTVSIRVSYAGAVATAATWGDSVKAAFDLYLPALAKQMGYQLPNQHLERRQFWNKMASLFLYRSPIKTSRWAATDSAPNIVADQENAKPADEGDGDSDERKADD
jgi:hypothetical protein